MNLNVICNVVINIVSCGAKTWFAFLNFIKFKEQLCLLLEVHVLITRYPNKKTPLLIML